MEFEGGASEGKGPTMNVAERLCLTDLRPLEKSRVDAVSAIEEDAARLTGMGVCRGREVTILKIGDPIILRVYGSRVAMSARLARRIQVLRPIVDPVVA
jgi:Fe2+ transport system protein FeoA